MTNKIYKDIYGYKYELVGKTSNGDFVLACPVTDSAYQVTPKSLKTKYTEVKPLQTGTVWVRVSRSKYGDVGFGVYENKPSNASCANIKTLAIVEVPWTEGQGIEG